MPMNQLMDVFYFSRLAARVFTADPDGWLIKGGQALLVRYAGAARLSRDIDLQCASPETTVEEAAARLIAAAQRDLGDHLRFAPTRFTPHVEEARGGAQRFDVYLGPRKATHVKVDLVVGRTLSGPAERRSLAPAVDIAWPVDWPTARLYPTVDHVADKLCAMYEKHPGGASSNRYRDLADLLLISQQETLDGAEAHQALHREAARRVGTGIHVELPATFEVPDATWRRNYPRRLPWSSGFRAAAPWTRPSLRPMPSPRRYWTPGLPQARGTPSSPPGAIEGTGPVDRAAGTRGSHWSRRGISRTPADRFDFQLDCCDQLHHWTPPTSAAPNSSPPSSPSASVRGGRTSAQGLRSRGGSSCSTASSRMLERSARMFSSVFGDINFSSWTAAPRTSPHRGSATPRPWPC
ncbi:nucleotidyl transferase AbiEii/AbiGii toxin family protein [Streptomyces sp. NPDC006925]|uniref:nucleotidyl transferase AbiEii/AbiGii toxin family protein n=1 Tax=Streptomyces sp. NPDC006925 TaxID=3364768 RepID=UPI0036A47FE0